MGALPYVLRDLPDVPIYGTKLTLGLMRTKLREHKLADKVNATEITPGTPFKVGPFACDSYYVCHSIPDAVGLTIETRYGNDRPLRRLEVRPHAGGRQADGLRAAVRDRREGRAPAALGLDARRGSRGTRSPSVTSAIFSTRSCRALQDGSSPRRSPRTSRASSRSWTWPRRGGETDGDHRALDGRTTRGHRARGRLPHVPGGRAHPAQGDRQAPGPRALHHHHRQPGRAHERAVTHGARRSPSRRGEGRRHRGHVGHADPGQRGAREPPPSTTSSSSAPRSSTTRACARTFRVTRGQEELKLLLNISAAEVLHPGARRVPDARAPRAHRDRPGRGRRGNVFVITNGRLARDRRPRRAPWGQKVASGVVYVDGLGVGDASQSVMRDRWSIGSDGIFLVVLTIERQTGKVLSGPDIVTKGFPSPKRTRRTSFRAAPKQRISSMDWVRRRPASTSAEVATLRRLDSTTSVTAYLYERTKRRPMVLPVVVEV